MSVTKTSTASEPKKQTQHCNSCTKDKPLDLFYIDSRTLKRKKTCIKCTLTRQRKVAAEKRGRVGFCRVVSNPILCLPY